jgi:hypothetical protein
VLLRTSRVRKRNSAYAAIGGGVSGAKTGEGGRGKGDEGRGAIAGATIKLLTGSTAGIATDSTWSKPPTI